ncbi:unnamed protein product [Clavelina lepadiformis]|uniref:Uncharacterized protein n=1 Tax=Clavelina lepadiformis TaxID=159417 RepID=A0ABP0F4D1_CLALP
MGYIGGLTVIPHNLASNVEALDLSYNAIRQIKLMDFRQYPKLNLLNLLGNSHKGLSKCQADFYIEVRTRGFAKSHSFEMADSVLQLSS